MHVILKRLKLILNEKDAPGAASSVREFACVCFDVLAVAAKYLPSRVLHEIVIEHDKVEEKFGQQNFRVLSEMRILAEIKVVILDLVG